MDQSVPCKPLGALPQGSGPKVISNATSLINEGLLISAEVDARLCKCCWKLVVDVLADSVASSIGWETVRSRHFSLSYLKKHQDGTVESLLQSATGHCKLCKLMAQELRRMVGNPDLDQAYHIFVWIQVPKKCEFFLGLGSISNFLQETRLRDSQPIPFTLFRRNGCDMSRSNLNKQLIFKNGAWPPLPAWPNQFPGSTEAIHRAQCWLHECVNNHKKCSRSQCVLPKRVLDIGTSESLTTVALYVTKGEVAQYVTLSYAWGSSLPLKTTRDNFDEHCAGIPFEALPETLIHTIIITKRLGFRYLWIDALCIIQGDAADWAEQAAAMTDIYKGSTLTLSTLSSCDCDYGILKKLPDHGFWIGTYFRPDDSSGQGEVFIGTPLNKLLDLGAKHLSSRGWTFQETLVSVASLHYTDEGMVWKCASGTFLEHDQHYRQLGWKSEWTSLMQNRLLGQANWPGQTRESNSQEDQYYFWNRWVGEFSERNLTFERDRLPAMAGIAKSFADKFRLTYVAGLWKENLISGLLWQRHYQTKTLTRSHGAAPSWSWASVKGRRRYRNLKISASSSGTDLVILNIDVKEDHPGTFGSVSHGMIEAEGIMQEVVVDRSVHPTPRKRIYQECGIVKGTVADAKFICMLDEFVESADALYPCWCLRVGTHNADGREGAILLLLEKVNPHGNQFRRVGVAEVDPWDNATIYESGEIDFFLSGQRLRFTLV